MTRLSRFQLREFARVLVLANTPGSLYKGLIACSGMTPLRKTPPEELVEYFENITARHKTRDEITVALAYAVLSAILLRAQDANAVPVDASRLSWGERIRNHVSKAIVSSTTTSIRVAPPEPQTTLVNAPPAHAPGQVLGADGNPIIWRN